MGYDTCPITKRVIPYHYVVAFGYRFWLVAAIDALREEGKDTKGVLVVIDKVPDNLLKQNV